MGNVITVNLDWIIVKISTPIERQMSRKSSVEVQGPKVFGQFAFIFLPVSTAILNPIS